MEFETPEEALAAIQQLNHTDLDGRQIFVREVRTTHAAMATIPGPWHCAACAVWVLQCRTCQLSAAPDERQQPPPSCDSRAAPGTTRLTCSLPCSPQTLNPQAGSGGLRAAPGGGRPVRL